MASITRLAAMLRQRRRGVIRLMLIAAGITVMARVWMYGYYATTAYKCVRCRTVRNVTIIPSLGISWGLEQENIYTRWYAERSPQHTHQWGWCGTVITHEPIGMGRACGVQSGVWQIDLDRQQKFVESAPPAKVEQFYTDLLSHDRQVRNHVVEMIYDWVPEDAQ